MRTLLLSLILATLAGCSSWGFPGVYKINIEQGNIVTQEMIDQLKPGMTRRQVRYVLGTPLVEDSFNRDRWDYIYTLRNGNRILRENRLTVFFDDDTLTHFDSTLPPSEAAPASDEEPTTQATADASVETSS